MLFSVLHQSKVNMFDELRAADQVKPDKDNYN